MEKIPNWLKIFLSLIVCYGFFQYGRIHDDGVKIYQPEYNHVVVSDRADIVLDTAGNPYAVYWDDDMGKSHSFILCEDCAD